MLKPGSTFASLLYSVYLACTVAFVAAMLAVIWLDLSHPRREEAGMIGASAVTVGMAALLTLAATRIYSDAVSRTTHPTATGASTPS